MRDKAPTEAPLTTLTFQVCKETVTVPVKINQPAWLAWFAQGLDFYRRTNRYTDPAYRDYGKFEPPDIYTGLVAFADGVSWNPGNGEGNYIYDGGNWRFLTNPTDDIQSLLSFIPDHQNDVDALNKKVEGLASQLSMIHDYKSEIDRLSKSFNDSASQLAMIPDYPDRLANLEKDLNSLKTELSMRKP